MKNGKYNIKSTLNNPDLYTGLIKKTENNVKVDNIVKIFDDSNNAKIYAKNILNWNPRLKKLDSDGYYLNYIRGKSERMSVNYIMDNIGWGIDSKTNRRFHIGYENLKDFKTIKFIIVHKKII